MVVFNRICYPQRQLPLAQQCPSHVGMIESKSLALDVMKAETVLIGGLNHFPAEIGNPQEHDQSSDIMQNT